MHKKTKAICAAVFIIIFSAISSSISFSQRSYDPDKAALKDRIGKYRKILSERKREERGINKTVKAVEIELERIGNEISNAQTQIRSKDEVLQSLHKDLERTKTVLRKLQSAETVAKTKLDKSQSEYNAYRSKDKVRIVADYKNSWPGIRMLFASTSYGDFKSRMAYLRIPANEKKNILKKIKRLKDSISVNKKQLSETQRNIKNTIAFITSKQNDISRIESIISDRKNYINHLQNEYKDLSKKHTGLLRHKKTIENSSADEQHLAALEHENKKIEAELIKMKQESAKETHQKR